MVGLLRDLSELSGGLRFRSMDLLGVDGAHFLLRSCAGTLETLRVRCNIQIRKGVLKDPVLRLSDPPADRMERSLTADL